MSETNENPVDTNAAPYSESDDFVPDPTAAFGTLDTSGTAGGDNESVDSITPVFDAARAKDLAYAAAALDPDDDSNTDTSSVVLPDEGLDNDTAKENVAAAAEAAAGVKVQDPSLTQAEEDNEAKESGDLTAADVEASQREGSSVGGSTTSAGEGGFDANSGDSVTEDREGGSTR